MWDSLPAATSALRAEERSLTFGSLPIIYWSGWGGMGLGWWGNREVQVLVFGQRWFQHVVFKEIKNLGKNGHLKRRRFRCLYSFHHRKEDSEPASTIL